MLAQGKFFLYNATMQGLDTSKLVVYTAITGKYDAVLEPQVIDVNCDYICFIDSPPAAYHGVWQFRPIQNESGLDSVRLARRYKLLPHLLFPEYAFSIYVDGNLQINASLREYLARYAGSRPMLCQRHPERDCIYEEAAAVLNFRLDEHDIVCEQMQRYRLEGFPSHIGLTCTNVLFRQHHDPDVIRLMNDWWAEVSAGSRRDQLSFSYAVWKNQFKYDKTPLFSHGNSFWTAAERHGSRKISAKKKTLRQRLNILYKNLKALLEE